MNFEEVIKLSAIDDQKWLEDTTGGINKTFIGEKQVLQRRPVSQMNRWKAIELLSKRFPESQLLQGLKYEIVDSNDNYLWTLSPRVNMGNKDFSFQQVSFDSKTNWDKVKLSWRDCLETLKVLHNIDLKEFPLELFRGHSVVLPHQQMRPFQVQLTLEKSLNFEKNFFEKIPAEPEFKNEPEWFIGHGDAVIRNMVQTENGLYVLIDWEGISVFPKCTDLTHFFYDVLSRTEPQLWVDYIDDYLSEAAEFSLLKEKDFVAALIWFVLREIAGWHGQSGLTSLSLDQFKEGIGNLNKKCIKIHNKLS